MKAIKITYWITTVLIAFSLLSAGIMYFTSADMPAAFTYLGFPDYFRVELGTAKIIGALLLVLPMLPRNVKEWAYAGTGIVFISAAWAHGSLGDPASAVITPLVQFVLLGVSYWAFTRIKAAREVPAPALS